MTLISYSFRGVTQRKTAKTFCTGCGKKLSRTVSRQYYDNGFHNVSETRAKNAVEIDKEVAELTRKGCLCKGCEEANDGLPVLKKLSKDEYEVWSREAKSKRLGLIRHTDEFCSWVKWRIVSPRSLPKYPNGAKRYNGFKTLGDAREMFKEIAPPPKRALRTPPSKRSTKEIFAERSADMVAVFKGAKRAKAL